MPPSDYGPELSVNSLMMLPVSGWLNGRHHTTRTDTVMQRGHHEQRLTYCFRIGDVPDSYGHLI
jgi:hypothetical protein